MLALGEGVEIHGDAGGDEDRGVVDEVELAGKAVDDGEGGEEGVEGKPACVEAEVGTGEGECAEGVALDDGGVAGDAVDGETEEEGARGDPAEVESPREPEGAGADVGQGEKQAEGDGDGDAGAVGAGWKG